MIRSIVYRLCGRQALHVAGALALSFLGTASCAKPKPSPNSESLALAEAHRILSLATLPPRAEVLAAAHDAAKRATEAPHSAEHAAPHFFAAGALLERLYRAERNEADLGEARAMYANASENTAPSAACDAAIALALLEGDSAHDPSATYSELFRAEKRFAKNTSCVLRIGAEIRRVDEWKPSDAVLDAIAKSVSGELLVPAAVPDGGALVRTAPRVLKIDEWPGEEAARFVIQLDRSSPFRVGDEVAVSGARTFIELEGADLGSPAFSHGLSGVVKELKGEETAAGARISFEVNGRAYRKVFHLPEPYRIVVDIAKNPPGTRKNVRNVARVALDPGHGGYDPGAKGGAGVQEKEVTLDVARRVGEALSRDGIEPLLTREGDRFVTLEERTAKANSFNADLFVSIHCNAAETKTKHGIETYVLDTSVSDMAGRVAARENATSAAANAELGAILATMRLADQKTRSVHFAELLQRSAVKSLSAMYPDISDGGVHTAGFHVLVGARMPAVLFEASYISNANDEQRLGSADYRQRLADAIVNAVRAYKEGR